MVFLLVLLEPHTIPDTVMSVYISYYIDLVLYSFVEVICLVPLTTSFIFTLESVADRKWEKFLLPK